MESDRPSAPYPLLFVGGLPSTTTVEQLQDYFSRYGHAKILGVIIKKTSKPRFGQNKVCKGFGYLKLANWEDAYELMNYEYIYEGRRLDIEIAYEKETKKDMSRENNLKKVYVSNIASITTDSDLEQYFSQFGTVVKAYRIKDHKSKHNLNFGYVIFSSKESANLARLYSEQGRATLHGSSLQVELYLLRCPQFQINTARPRDLPNDSKNYYAGSQPSDRHHRKASVYAGRSNVVNIQWNSFGRSPASKYSDVYLQEAALYLESRLFKRGAFTESRASNIYLEGSGFYDRDLKRSAFVKGTSLSHSKAANTIKIVKPLKNNETKPKIDAIMSQDPHSGFDHSNRNIMFNVVKPSSRIVDEIPSLKHKKDNISRFNAFRQERPLSILRQSIELPESRITHASRHSHVDPSAGHHDQSRRSPGNTSSMSPQPTTNITPTPHL